MRSRYDIYCDILRAGLLNIRGAASEGDADQCHAEADHLHNIPELLTNFDNEGLHRYYWDAMKPSYLGASKPRWARSFSQLWGELENANEQMENS